MNYNQAVEREVKFWPGVQANFSHRSKHSQVTFEFNGASRFVVLPSSPGDNYRGVRNKVCEVRRTLRHLGAVRV